MKKNITFILLTFMLNGLLFSQNDSISLLKKNEPSGKKWFIEIGTSGIGYSVKTSNNGILTDKINTSNLNTKLPSLTLYFVDKTDTSFSYYTGYGVEFSSIGGTFDIDDNLKVINSGWSTMSSGIGWNVISMKAKFRTYMKMNKKISFSFGVGYSYNLSSIDEFNIFYSNGGVLDSYKVSSVSTESYNFVGDFGFNWDVVKWLSIGARIDYDGSYKIKINDIASIYGSYDSYSNANFITISPTLRLKF